MTKKELSQLYYLNREIEQQKIKLAELETASTNISPQITGMPHAPGTSDKISKYAAEMADLRALIELNIQKCWFEFNRLNRYIAGIDDSLTRQIMSLRYVNGMSWQQVANRVGGDNTADSVRMIHNRYLANS